MSQAQIIDELRKERLKLLVLSSILFVLIAVIYGIVYATTRQDLLELGRFFLEKKMPAPKMAAPPFLYLSPLLILVTGLAFVALAYSWIRHWEKRLSLLSNQSRIT